MKYKTILRTLPFSLLLSFLILFLLHFLGKWTIESDQTPSSYVVPGGEQPIIIKLAIETWDNKCLLLNNIHSTIIRNEDKSDVRFLFSNIKFIKSFEFTVFEHFWLLLLFSVLTIPLLYRFLK